MTTQRGFILPLTLWLLAAMTIVVGIFAARLMSALDLAEAGQRRTQAMIDISDTRAELLFRLGTAPLSLYGLGAVPGQAIALDDRPYRGEGQSVVRLQDDRGLLNLNLASDERLHRLLGLFDVPFEQRGPLVDRLRDYIDEDDFKRLNGAEARDYAAADLPPPRNNRLLISAEVFNVLGWRDWPLLLRAGGVADLTSVGTSVAFNPNTAPWQVLATLPGVTNELAQQMIELRRIRPFFTPDDIAQLMGVSGGSLFLQVMTFPSDTVRITHTVPGQRRALRYTVAVMPNGERAPWRIDYQSSLESPDTDEPIDSLPPLPERSALPANSGTPLLPF